MAWLNDGCVTFKPRGMFRERAARQAKAARGQGGSSYGGASYGTRAPREMHDVTRASCGTATQVPFKPSSGRPVYCRNCFQR